MSNTIGESLDFNFRDLVVFLSVAAGGSFRRAAAQLYVSQPAVTRSIARLERSLGTVLLQRGARGATLTAAGHAFQIRARRMVASVHDMYEESRDGWQSSIHFGAAATAAGSYLAPFLAEWIPAHPKTRLQMIEDGSVRLRTRLKDGECDLAIVTGPIPVSLEAHPITRVGLRAYFRADHPLAGSADPLSLAELARYPVLVNNRTFLSVQMLLAAFDEIGARPRIVYESSSGQTLAALAKAGLGVAVFGDSVAISDGGIPSRAVADRLGDQLGFDLYVAWPRSGTLQHIRDFGLALSSFTTARLSRGGA